MKALILAAGYATRLYPLTKEYPKPLLQVAGRPMIDYIVDKLASVDEVDEIIVITNSKFIERFREWAGKQVTQKKISLVDDQTRSLHDRRGAIGDIAFAIDQGHIADDLLVIGGDNLFDEELVEFVAFAQAQRPMPVIGAYDIAKIAQASKYGVIKVDSRRLIIDFQEKPKNPESTLVAMCLYFFPREKLPRIGEYLDSKTDKKDATGFYIDWLTKKEKVMAYIFQGHWYDIGHHELYNKAKEHYSDGDA